MGAFYKLCSIGPFLIRMGLGAVFAAHGGQKVFGLFGGGGLEATVQGFVSMGSPEWVGYAVSLGELLGGLGIFFGFLTRIAALGPAVIMGGGDLPGSLKEWVLPQPLYGRRARTWNGVRTGPFVHVPFSCLYGWGSPLA